MSGDVRLQVQQLRSQLGVSEQPSVRSRKRSRRLRLPLDYSQLHALQDRYDALRGQDPVREREKLPPLPARVKPLVLPDLKVEGDPDMQSRVRYCRRELARSEGSLRAAQEENDRRLPFLPAPGVQVSSKALPRSTTFVSESRASYRGLSHVPGLPRRGPVPPPPGAPGSRHRAVAPYF